MKAARAWPALALLLAGSAVAQSPESLALLRRMQDATRNLSYTGTFVYQQGNRSETSRITRLASADTERLEVLDGVPRELVRTRDTVRCYLPEARLVKLERRMDRATPGRAFPSLLPEQLGSLAQHYEISLGDARRISGYECRAVVLAPKDKLRYGYRLYADTRSGMLLSAVTVDSGGRVIEDFTFKHLRIGPVTAEMVRPSHAAAAWRVEDAEASPAHLDGWRLTSELPGFQKVMELKRRMGDSRAVGQVVYSDGLAAISVFIEPLQASDKARTGLASMGAINIYTREVANHMVTVVGEAPAESVQRIANAVEYRRPEAEPRR